MENLCNLCKRICKARNEDRVITVISCDAYIKDYDIIHRTVIQTRLINDLGFV
jgi:hypothetical protein